MHKKLDRQPFVDAYLIHKKPYLEKKVMAYLFTETHGLVATMTHWSTAKKKPSVRILSSGMPTFGQT